ncbi:hypothetical protein Tco_1231692, partial [Tanacetum coccineum]
MAISVILVSSDSSEDSAGTPAGRVILFGTILTTISDTTPSMIPPTTHIDTTQIPTVSPTIPSSPDYTPASPDYSPASDMKFDPSKDPSSDHIPPLPATSPFHSSTDDSSDSDIPDSPPSPNHGTPFTETTLSTQRSPTASGALRLDYSSSDHFSSDDSSSRSSSSSSSKTSSDSSTNALSDSASSRSSSDHSLPASPSDHLMILLLRALLARGVDPLLHLYRYLHLPLEHCLMHMLIFYHHLETATDLEGCSEDSFEPYVPREAGLGVYFEDESSKPSRSRGTNLEMDVDVERSDGIEIDPEVQSEIDECNAYADALRDKGIDARVVFEAIDREEIETGMRGPVEVRVDRVTHPVVADDIPEPAQEGAVEVTYETGQLSVLICWRGSESQSGIIGDLETLWMLRVRELRDFSV